jgi:hypothetical protein
MRTFLYVIVDVFGRKEGAVGLEQPTAPRLRFV